MGLRALIIDDDCDLRIATCDLLESIGIEVSEAQNGHIAFDILKRTVPEVVIVDINMPLMDGVTFVETLRREGFPISRIMIFSGSLSQKRLARLASLQVKHFVVKPMNPMEFLEKVNEIAKMNPKL